MDAEKLGRFIADRRRELGLTQVRLAEQLHVTDKAVSRWETGIGLPDNNSVEPLARALEVSLVELMQAKRKESETICTQEVEQLVESTIRLSRPVGIGAQMAGGGVVILFVAVSVWLMAFVWSYGAGFLSAGSIILGLAAWGIPIWCMSFGRHHGGLATSMSYGTAMISILLQIVQIVGSTRRGDWASIEDTVGPLTFVCIAFSAVTVFLNVTASVIDLHKKK